MGLLDSGQLANQRGPDRLCQMFAVSPVDKTLNLIVCSGVAVYRVRVIASRAQVLPACLLNQNNRLTALLQEGDPCSKSIAHNVNSLPSPPARC